MTRSVRSGIVAAIGLAAFGLSAVGHSELGLGAGPRAAGAATATPGVLSTAELPAGYAQPGSAQTFATFSLPTINPSACTETPTQVPGITSASLVTFSPPGAPTSTAGLSEAVLSFADAKAAKVAYAARVKNDKARWKCAAVGFVPVSQSAPIATINYAKAKVPKIGSGSFASSGTTAAGAATGPVTVTFVSGPYLVLVGFAAPPNAPSTTDTKAILKAAQQRLTQGPS